MNLEGDEKIRVQYERAKKRYKNALGKPTEPKQYKSYLKFKKAYQKIKRKKITPREKIKITPKEKNTSKKISQKFTNGE